jgi:hypothetical protein
LINRLKYAKNRSKGNSRAIKNDSEEENNNDEFDDLNLNNNNEDNTNIFIDEEEDDESGLGDPNTFKYDVIDKQRVVYGDVSKLFFSEKKRINYEIFRKRQIKEQRLLKMSQSSESSNKRNDKEKDKEKRNKKTSRSIALHDDDIYVYDTKFLQNVSVFPFFFFLYIKFICVIIEIK